MKKLSCNELPKGEGWGEGKGNSQSRRIARLTWPCALTAWNRCFAFLWQVKYQ